MYRVRKQIFAEGEVAKRYTGHGITVAVLDTGVAAHPDLKDRVIAFKDFVHGRVKQYDDSGHGTHVCGIICGTGELSQGRYAGIAPGVKLVVGKVLDRNGDGSVETLLKGLSWVADLKDRFRIRALNVSIGTAELDDKLKESYLKHSLEKLWDNGITVICAAGNNGPVEGSISTIVESRKVIAVGCHDGAYCKDMPHSCEYYSGRGRSGSFYRKPDVVALGTDIISCNAAMVCMNGKYIDAYIRKSGTSMATPIVTGAAALFYEKNMHESNEAFRKKMIFSAMDLEEPWNKQGWGMINIQGILD